jgi:hypothetical protein
MTTPEEPTEGGGAGETPRRSAAAAAASRARRIGGRVASGSQPQRPAGADRDASNAPAAAAPVTEPARTVGVELPPPPPGTVVVAVPAWLRWAPAGVLSVGAVVMAVLLILFSHGVWWGKTSASAEREQVLAAAKTCVATTQSYRYNELDSFERKALACAAGQFRSQLQQTIRGVLKKQAPVIKAVQTARIDRGGIEAITKNGHQWTLLIYGELSVTNTKYPKGQTDPFAAQARVEKVGGHWLLVGLETVSTPL